MSRATLVGHPESLQLCQQRVADPSSSWQTSSGLSPVRRITLFSSSSSCPPPPILATSCLTNINQRTTPTSIHSKSSTSSGAAHFWRLSSPRSTGSQRLDYTRNVGRTSSDKGDTDTLGILTMARISRHSAPALHASENGRGGDDNDPLPIRSRGL